MVHANQTGYSSGACMGSSCRPWSTMIMRCISFWRQQPILSSLQPVLVHCAQANKQKSAANGQDKSTVGGNAQNGSAAFQAMGRAAVELAQHCCSTAEHLANAHACLATMRQGTAQSRQRQQHDSGMHSSSRRAAHAGPAPASGSRAVRSGQHDVPSHRHHSKSSRGLGETGPAGSSAANGKRVQRSSMAFYWCPDMSSDVPVMNYLSRSQSDIVQKQAAHGQQGVSMLHDVQKAARSRQAAGAVSKLQQCSAATDSFDSNLVQDSAQDLHAPHSTKQQEDSTAKPDALQPSDLLRTALGMRHALTHLQAPDDACQQSSGMCSQPEAWQSLSAMASRLQQQTAEVCRRLPDHQREWEEMQDQLQAAQHDRQQLTEKLDEATSSRQQLQDAAFQLEVAAQQVCAPCQHDELRLRDCMQMAACLPAGTECKGLSCVQHCSVILADLQVLRLSHLASSP